MGGYYRWSKISQGITANNVQGLLYIYYPLFCLNCKQDMPYIYLINTKISKYCQKISVVWGTIE